MNADPIARIYRWLEYASFGRALERCRFRFVSDVAGVKSALLLGDGDGRFLEHLLRVAPDAVVDTIDTSSAMLQLAASRCHGRITFRHEDARTCALPQARFALIATHFFLDCLDPNEMKAMVDRLACAGAPACTWLVSEFRQPTWWARWTVGGLYFFFRWTTGLKVRQLADHRPMLRAAGFTLQEEHRERGGLLAAERWVRR